MECGATKPLLFSDLFKNNHNNNKNDSFSSSSDYTDFIADLTRQMADCMLQEDEHDNDTSQVHKYSYLDKKKKKKKKKRYGNRRSMSHMQPVFIGSMPESVHAGTGVFLPQIGIATKLPRPRNEPGSTVVLMPTRVLQLLEHHFNRLQDLSKADPKDEEESEAQQVQVQLPQEWTY